MEPAAIRNHDTEGEQNTRVSRVLLNKGKVPFRFQVKQSRSLRPSISKSSRTGHSLTGRTAALQRALCGLSQRYVQVVVALLLGVTVCQVIFSETKVVVLIIVHS